MPECQSGQLHTITCGSPSLQFKTRENVCSAVATTRPRLFSFLLRRGSPPIYGCRQDLPRLARQCQCQCHRNRSISLPLPCPPHVPPRLPFLSLSLSLTHSTPSQLWLFLSLCLSLPFAHVHDPCPSIPCPCRFTVPISSLPPTCMSCYAVSSLAHPPSTHSSRALVRSVCRPGALCYRTW